MMIWLSFGDQELLNDTIFLHYWTSASPLGLHDVQSINDHSFPSNGFKAESSNIERAAAFHFALFA